MVKIYGAELSICKLINLLIKVEFKTKKIENFLELKYINLHKNLNNAKNEKFNNSYSRFLKLLYFKEYLIKLISIKIENTII